METGNETDAKAWAPRFFLIWSGQALSLLGSSLVQFALVWWLTAKTGSATVLATATAMMPLSLLVAGPLSDLLGIRTWFFFGGAACAAMAFVAYSVPAIRNIERNSHKAMREQGNDANAGDSAAPKESAAEGAEPKPGSAKIR